MSTNLKKEQVTQKSRHPAEDWRIDQVIMVRDADDEKWARRRFSHFDVATGQIHAFFMGACSWGSTEGTDHWEQARLPTEAELNGAAMQNSFELARSAPVRLAALVPGENLLN